MANKPPGLSEQFLSQARKLSSLNIYFVIDGSSLAREGYKFKPEGTDPVAEALGIMQETRETLPGANIMAAYWEGKNGLSPIDLDTNPFSWPGRVPGGNGSLFLALDELQERYSSSALPKPLHVIITHQFLSSDGDAVKRKLGIIRKYPGLSVDIVVHSDTPSFFENIAAELNAENPANPINVTRILTPAEMRDALRRSAYGWVEKQLAQADEKKLKTSRDGAALASDVISHGLHADSVAPTKAHFRKK